MCAVCQGLVEKLDIVMQKRRAGKDRLTSATEARLEAGRQAAWQALLDDLFRHLELLGNLLYASSEAKQDAIDAQLPSVSGTS